MEFLSQSLMLGLAISDGDKRGSSLVSVGSKLISTMIIFRLRDGVGKVRKRDQNGFRNGIGFVDPIFALRLIYEMFLIGLVTRPFSPQFCGL